MHFALSGQLRRAECRRVMTQASALCRKLEPWFADLSNRFIDKFSILLRIDGSIGSFGRLGFESVHDDSGTVVRNLVIKDLGGVTFQIRKSIERWFIAY